MEMRFWSDRVEIALELDGATRPFREEFVSKPKEESARRFGNVINRLIAGENIYPSQGARLLASDLRRNSPICSKARSLLR